MPRAPPIAPRCAANECLWNYHYHWLLDSISTRIVAPSLLAPPLYASISTRIVAPPLLSSLPSQNTFANATSAATATSDLAALAASRGNVRQARSSIVSVADFPPSAATAASAHASVSAYTGSPEVTVTVAPAARIPTRRRARW